MSEHEQPTIAWEQERSLGGHASAAIACEHPHLRPIDVYRRMTDDESPEPSDEMLWGRMLEPLLIEWASRKLLGGEIESITGATRSLKYPFLHSAPDGKFEGSSTSAPGLISAKHVGGYRARYWGSSKTDRIPPYATIQENLYMGLLGESVSYVVASIGGKAPELWAVPFDDRIFDAVVDFDESFMRRHVLTRTPPPPDGSEAYKRWIADRVHQRRAELLAVGTAGELRDIVEEYRRARLAFECAEAGLKLQDQRLRVAIGEAGGLELKDTDERITYRATKKTDKNGNPIRTLLVPKSFKGNNGEDE